MKRRQFLKSVPAVVGAAAALKYAPNAVAAVEGIKPECEAHNLTSPKVHGCCTNFAKLTKAQKKAWSQAVWNEAQFLRGNDIWKRLR